MSLDREIEDLLAVDPSPGFVVKVRQRIAQEPAPAASWFSWRLATAGAGLAIVGVAVLLWPTSAPLAPTASTTNAAIAPIAPIAPLAPATSASAAVATAVGKPSPSRTLAPSNHSASTPVLIQRDEARAMELLLRRVSDRTLPDMTEALAAVDAAGPTWIEIPAVVIDPIPQGEGE
jgi:hypothetical protein